MKKLLWLLFLLPFFASAQIPVIRGSNSVTAEDYRLYIINSFRLPVFADTTEANVNKGLDSIGTLINMRGTKWVLIRVPSLGTFKKWDTLGGSGSGGVSGDTVFLYQIGTAAGQIETLYVVDGNLRKSRWVPGYGTLPFLAPDSAAYIDIDTTSIAYKSWVIQQFGTAVNNLQQVIDNGNKLSKNDTINGVGLYSFEFDSLSEFDIKDNAGNSLFQVFPTVSTAIMQGFNSINAAVSNISTSGLDSTAGISANNGLTIGNGSGAIATFSLKQQAAQANTRLYWPAISNTIDTLATLSDVRAGGGGGGSSGYSVTTAANTANYTVPTGRRIFVYLSDLTGQANRNVVLPAATTGDEFVFVNLNTVASGFFWTFTSGTVKDNTQSTITTLGNLTTYHIVYGGTNYQIIN